MCGKDDTKIAIYNLKECTESEIKNWYIQFMSWRKPYETNNLVCSEDKFNNLVCVILSWIVKFNRFSSGINLVLQSTLYKFIIWAINVWAQSGFGINTISVPTPCIWIMGFSNIAKYKNSWALEKTEILTCSIK